MKENKKSLIIYFFEMLFIFLIIDTLMSLIASGVAQSSLFYKYGKQLIYEIFYACIVLIVMLLFKNSYVFTDKREKFWNGIMLGIPMLAISVLNFASSVLNIGSFNITSLINVIVFCIFVGIAEEFLCRGWLQNEFIERFSSNKKDVITSIILSSFVFGIIHLVNLTIQTPFETFLQIVNAMSLGFLLGVIYYKTKNIWVVIFLHAFYDFSIMLGEIGLVKNCTYNTPTIGVSIYGTLNILVISALWILGAIYVLHKCDFDERPKKHNDSLLSVFMVAIIVLLLVPFERFIPGYENYVVCYHYKEISEDEIDNFIIHYPDLSKYTIKYSENNFESYDSLSKTDYNFTIYMNKDEKIVISNDNTNYERVFDYKNVVSYEVFESNDSYNIAILTDENESTLYLSTSIKKENISNENDYLDNIAFSKFVFPEIMDLGYIEYNDDNYAYLISEYYDIFIIKNDEAILVK